MGVLRCASCNRHEVAMSREMAREMTRKMGRRMSGKTMNRRMPFMIAFLIPLITGLMALSCRAEATAPPTVAVAHDPLLQHYDIRPDRLAAPFATRSAGNPPIMGARPANAALHLPPGFRIELWATKLGDPRTMIVAPNGDIFVSEPGAGRIDVFRDTGHTGHPDHQ